MQGQRLGRNATDRSPSHPASVCAWCKEGLVQYFEGAQSLEQMKHENEKLCAAKGTRVHKVSSRLLPETYSSRGNWDLSSEHAENVDQTDHKVKWNMESKGFRMACVLGVLALRLPAA